MKKKKGEQIVVLRDAVIKNSQGERSRLIKETRKRFIIFLVVFSVLLILLLYYLFFCCHHKWVAATCSTPKTCSVCGKTKGEALGHLYDVTEIEKETCTGDGFYTYYCQRCSDYYEEKVPALGHSIVEKITLAPTCTKEGSEVDYCSRCGEIVEEKTLSLLPHNFSSVVVIKEPTCSSYGKGSRKCQDCSFEETVDIEKSAHKEGKRKTETVSSCVERTTVYCSVCGIGYESYDEQNHSFDNNLNYRKGYYSALCTKGCGMRLNSDTLSAFENIKSITYLDEEDDVTAVEIRKDESIERDDKLSLKYAYYIDRENVYLKFYFDGDEKTISKSRKNLNSINVIADGYTKEWNDGEGGRYLALGKTNETVLSLNRDQIGIFSLWNKSRHIKGLRSDCEIAPLLKLLGYAGGEGGIVFFDKGSRSDGWRFLEVSPFDFPDKVKWGWEKSSGKAETGTAVGDGMTNTTKIKDSVIAKTTKDYSSLGYSDWFIPSINELELIYRNLYCNGIGDLTEGVYWSSSSIDNGYAYWFDFAKGKRASEKTLKYDKNTALYVRLVRAF